MTQTENRPSCPVHGSTLHRAQCRLCNAAYQRGYEKRQRLVRPAQVVWDQARRRAKNLGLRFSLRREAVVIPPSCPVLGIPIETGGSRSAGSPSLDRIVPCLGYVEGNVRVISDRANRLKSDFTLHELTCRAANDNDRHAGDYARIAAYVDRELLLSEVRIKAAMGGRAGEEWAKVEAFLESAFVKADW